MQPFQHPYCTAEGIIFDLSHIEPWLKKHGTNPVDGKSLKSSELTKLNFLKNDEEEYVDPVTYKAFTDNTHIIALRNTGNVFGWDTIERLNIKAKNWKDLITDEDFTRKDIITLQDPQNLESRDLSSFKYVKEGVSTLTDEQQRERNDPTNNLNLAAMGSSAKVIRAKEAVAKARAERTAAEEAKQAKLALSKNLALTGQRNGKVNSMQAPKVLPFNAAAHTSGKAAASFTSTGLTPYTTNERALLSDEEYMLKPRRVKQKGYARIETNLGNLNIELNTEFAPKAVWNFIQLAKKGYYSNMNFHRNIRNFMIQGGDPTGSGRGGQSIWNKPFEDEFGQSPLTHSERGTISMANKGKNTNTSQFFIIYRPATHLDRKHTIFAKLVDEESEATLKKLENVKTDEGNRPTEDCQIENVTVFVNPFEEFLKNKAAHDAAEKEEEEIVRQGGREDDNTTWTGKRINGNTEATSAAGVGKYLDSATEGDDEVVEEIVDDFEGPPAKKKRVGGGFGNFDNW